MVNRIKLTFVLMTVFIAAALFLGTAAPKATTNHSPYVSALSNYAVGTAVAASARCTNAGCEALQGIVGCHRPEFPGTDCAVINGTCTMTPCHGH